MNVSEARLVANRLNALKSSGPKTDEGKAVSRRNGLKHGLAGEGVVVAEKDAQEIARRVDELEKDLRPKTANGAILIRVMAAASVKMERAASHESAAIAKNVRHAGANHDEGMNDEADVLFEGLAEEPRKNLRKLKRTPEGVDRLIEAWSDLFEELASDDPESWTALHLGRIARLTGKAAETARVSRLGALARAAGGDFLGLAKSDGEGLKDEARKAWAKDRLTERIAAEIVELEAHRETLDHQAFEQDRVEAPDRALFDPSKEATLARRYEADAARRYYRALDEFRKAEAKGETSGQVPKSAAPVGSPGAYGSQSPYDPMMAERAANQAAVPTTRGADGAPLVRVQRPQPAV